MRLIEQALARGLPILGICLGAQLIARALGAPSRPTPQGDRLARRHRHRGGPAPIRFSALSANARRSFTGTATRSRIPRGDVHLASSALCDNQAFRYGSNVYGFQFHLEADAPLIERWLRVPVHRRELESTHGAIAPDSIRDQTPCTCRAPPA